MAVTICGHPYDFKIDFTGSPVHRLASLECFTSKAYRCCVNYVLTMSKYVWLTVSNSSAFDLT